MKRRITRFSLRALLVLVTAICCVLGYGANWKYQRHRYLADQIKKWATPTAADSVNDFLRFSDKPGFVEVRAPYWLRPFGERGCETVPVIIKQGDFIQKTVVLEVEVPEIADSYTDWRRARRLFPEAKLCPLFVDGAAMSIPVVRSSTTGEVIFGIVEIRPGVFENRTYP